MHRAEPDVDAIIRRLWMNKALAPETLRWLCDRARRAITPERMVLTVTLRAPIIVGLDMLCERVNS